MADVVGNFHFSRPQKGVRHDADRPKVAEETEVGTGFGRASDKEWLKSRFLPMARVAAIRARVDGGRSCKVDPIEKNYAVGNR